MNLERLEQSIRLHEGYRPQPYLDSHGYLTIGWGHKISDMPVRHLEGDSLGEAWQWLCSRDQHEHWFKQDVQTAIRRARAWYGSQFYDLTDLRQEVVVEMHFQMGYGARFPEMRRAVRRGDYQKAGAEMRDSLWYAQTRNRAERLARRFETDHFVA